MQDVTTSSCELYIKLFFYTRPRRNAIPVGICGAEKEDQIYGISKNFALRILLDSKNNQLPLDCFFLKHQITIKIDDSPKHTFNCYKGDLHYIEEPVDREIFSTQSLMKQGISKAELKILSWRTFYFELKERLTENRKKVSKTSGSSESKIRVTIAINNLVLTSFQFQKMGHSYASKKKLQKPTFYDKQDSPSSSFLMIGKKIDMDWIDWKIVKLAKTHSTDTFAFPPVFPSINPVIESSAFPTKINEKFLNEFDFLFRKPSDSLYLNTPEQPNSAEFEAKEEPEEVEINEEFLNEFDFLFEKPSDSLYLNTPEQPNSAEFKAKEKSDEENESLLTLCNDPKYFSDPEWNLGIEHLGNFMEHGTTINWGGINPAPDVNICGGYSILKMFLIENEIACLLNKDIRIDITIHNLTKAEFFLECVQQEGTEEASPDLNRQPLRNYKLSPIDGMPLYTPPSSKCERFVEIKDFRLSTLEKINQVIFIHRFNKKLFTADEEKSALLTISYNKNKVFMFFMRTTLILNQIHPGRPPLKIHLPVQKENGPPRKIFRPNF